MQLNRVNKIYIGVAILLTGLLIYRVIRYQPWARCYYFSNICAPTAYPVYVRNAYFLTNNGELSDINDEDVNSFNTSWKTTHYFPETNGKDLLPEKLVLQYASYRDRLFYRDTIGLPADSIRRLYNRMIEGGEGVDIYYKGGDVPGLVFLVGIGNSGNILVWLKGSKSMHLVHRAALKPVEPGEDDTYYGEPMSPDAYLNDRFMGLPDRLRMRIGPGLDAHARYKDSFRVEY